MDLDSVVDELYGVDPGQFVSERDDRSKQARQAGDRDLAAAIKALRKPSASAWAVNLLARERSTELEQLLHLGEQLREAQATLSADQMRQLGRQRHQVVAGLTRELGRRARDHGVNLSDSVAREVEETLEAALADPEAAGAVRGGRLLRALSHAGLDPVDLTGAVAASPSGTAPARPAKNRAGGKPHTADNASGTDELRAARERKAEQARRLREQEAAEAEAEAEEAAARARDAATALEEASQDARQAAVRTSEAERAVQQLEQRLAEAREQAEAAASAEADAEQAEEASRSRAEAADREARKARDRAETLRGDLEEA